MLARGRQQIQRRADRPVPGSAVFRPANSLGTDTRGDCRGARWSDSQLEALGGSNHSLFFNAIHSLLGNRTGPSLVYGNEKVIGVE